ncbi:MAG: porin family protein [Nitrospira sp.]|nr:porin family protein [Nitrospira sp.]
MMKEGKGTWRVHARGVALCLALIAVSGLEGNSLADEGGTAGNMVVFRGGYVHLDSDRGNELFTDVHGAGGLNDSQHGWYVGAWLDHLLSPDVWGMMNDTAVVGEIGLQFNRIASKEVLSTSNLGLTGGNLGAVHTTAALQELTMVVVSVAPKIRFMQSHRLSPWVIPGGLDILVFSPPSNGAQYLDVGVQFGAGVDYNVWKAFRIGLEARYHLAANMTNSVTNNFLQVGPYLGISF